MRFALMAILALVGLTAAPARAADWAIYRYADLGFAASFPAPPTRMSKPQQTSGGLVPTEYVYVIEDGALYMVSSSDLSAEPDVWKTPDVSARAILDGALRDGTVVSPAARLPPAAAWEGATQIENNKRLRVRAYLRGERGFTVIVIGPTDHPERTTDAAAERFLGSFAPDGS